MCKTPTLATKYKGMTQMMEISIQVGGKDFIKEIQYKFAGFHLQKNIQVCCRDKLCSSSSFHVLPGGTANLLCSRLGPCDIVLANEMNGISRPGPKKTPRAIRHSLIYHVPPGWWRKPGDHCAKGKFERKALNMAEPHSRRRLDPYHPYSTVTWVRDAHSLC